MKGSPISGSISASKKEKVPRKKGTVGRVDGSKKEEDEGE